MAGSNSFPTHLGLAAALALGCGGGSSSPDAAPVPDAMPSPDCLEAPNHSDLVWIQEAIFTPNCASFTACHKGNASSAGGLNLETGNSEDNMVGVESELADMDLVVPGDPEASYLMVILGQFGIDDPRIDSGVGTMPFNNPLLCKPKRDAIERWITEMAP